MTQTIDTQPHPTPQSGVETRAHLVTDHGYDAAAVPLNATVMRVHNLAHAEARRGHNLAHPVARGDGRTSTVGGGSALRCVVVLWNVLMGLWIVSALSSTGGVMNDCATKACQAGASIGAGLAVGGILFVTAMVDVILGVIWMVTNKGRN